MFHGLSNVQKERKRKRWKVKVKAFPLQAMKDHGGCGCKGPHIHSQRGRVANPTLGRLYPRGKPSVLIL